MAAKLYCNLQYNTTHNNDDDSDDVLGPQLLHNSRYDVNDNNDEDDNYTKVLRNST